MGLARLVAFSRLRLVDLDRDLGEPAAHDRRGSVKKLIQFRPTASIGAGAVFAFEKCRPSEVIAVSCERQFAAATQDSSCQVASIEPEGFLSVNSGAQRSLARRSVTAEPACVPAVRSI